MDTLLHLPQAGLAGLETLPLRARIKRLLVVDDDRDIVAIAKMVLEIAGYEVRTALDGPAALAAFLEFRPHLVFLDLGLPGQDGFEVTRMIRQLPDSKSVFIAIVSGYSRDTDRKRATGAGANHFVTKPANFLAVVALAEAAAASEQ